MSLVVALILDQAQALGKLPKLEIYGITGVAFSARLPES
jgi:hypothetical protein